MIRIFFLMLISGATSAFGVNTTTSHYKIEQIEQVLDGPFGVKKLYFNLQCNQYFLQNLTQASGPNTLRIAILTELGMDDCSEPSRKSYVRYSPGGRELVTVASFQKVWHCSGTCFTPGGPDMPPSNREVYGFGTSKEQATEYLGCTPPYLQHLVCNIIQVEAVD